MKVLNKDEYFKTSISINTEDIQHQFKERFIETINKCIKNGNYIISYRELLDEGMSEASFYEVINLYIQNNWKINIKEFDIELG